jgi:hypothetical protein
LGQSKQRNLNDYDKINVNVPVGENPYPSVSKVRDFIWKHWKESTFGNAEMTLRSKEGDPTTTYIFIEPDESGVWRVAVKTESKFYDRKAISDPKRRGKFFHQTHSYEAYLVEQVNSPKRKTRINLKNQRNDFSLRLKDSNGNIFYF